MLHLLEQERHYCEACWSWQENHERGVDQEDNPSESHGSCMQKPRKKRFLTSGTDTSIIITGNQMVFGTFSMLVLVFSVPSPVEHQICPAVCVLMKLSFDEEHRHAMNELGELM